MDRDRDRDEDLRVGLVVGAIELFPLWPILILGAAIVVIYNHIKEARVGAAGVLQRDVGRRERWIARGVVVDPADSRRRLIELSAPLLFPLGPTLRAVHGAIAEPPLGIAFDRVDPPGWDAITAHTARVALASDGRRVIAWLGEPCTVEDIDRVTAVVRAVATDDTTLARLLASLPDATPDPSLSPGVVLAPDGLRVGVAGGAMFAALGDARFDFPAIERDRGQIMAAVDRLRDRARGDHDGPYR